MRRVFSSFVRVTKNQIKYIGLVAVGVVVGGAVTAVVQAAIPDNNNVIHACYTSTAIRIIDSSTASCSTGETAITWNGQTPGNFLASLQGADLSNSDLKYRNFADVNLNNANLGSAKLDGADFSRAKLKNSHLQGSSAINSNFHNANLTGADLTIANWQNTNTTGAIFTNTNLTQAQLTNIDVSNWNLPTITLSGTQFHNVNFSGRDFSGRDLGIAAGFESSTMQNSIFSNTTLDGALFDGSDLTGADFSGAQFLHSGSTSTFDGANLTNTNFSNAHIFFVNMQSVPGGVTTNLTGTSFTNATIDSSFFGDSDLSSANLTGVTWINVRCPDFTNSDDNGGTCIGHLTP